MSRILIVEDQADIRRLIRWTLEPDNHEIHEATNGLRGLKAALELRPDLVVLDVMMPGELDGHAVCRQLKADAGLGGVPVLMLTALAQERDRAAARESGADAHLAKPFMPLELVETIDRLLKARAPAGLASP